MVGNPVVGRIVRAGNLRRLRQIKKIDKICVLSDLNIGDAIMPQAAILALRKYFPTAQIDCMVSRFAEKLVAKNPEISNLYPIYSGSSQATEDDFRSIKEILVRSNYDLIFNFCPFFPTRRISFSKKTRIINYLGLIITVLRAEKDPEAKSHIIYSMNKFIHALFSDPKSMAEAANFPGIQIVLPQKAVSEAKLIIENTGFKNGKPIIFFNPDTSSRFTRIPFHQQVVLLKKLIDLPCNILLRAVHAEKKLESHLLDSLPAEGRNNIYIIPASVPIDTYAALVDHCGIFLTGDTGPMHIAAARKVFENENYVFRNRTAVFSIFGTGAPRIYGYDSTRPGYFPAYQDAPSRIYISENHYRNLAYINKTFIAHKDEKLFFDHLDTDEIAGDIKAYLSQN